MKQIVLGLFLLSTLAPAACQSSSPKTSKPTEGGDPSPVGDRSGSDPLTRLDVSAIVQQTVDAEVLEGYYHVDKLPQRSPLRVLLRGRSAEGIAVDKFGEPVVFIDDDWPHEHGGPYLEVQSIRPVDGGAVVQLSYPPEGLVGTFHFRRDGSGWSLGDVDLAER